MQMFFQNQMTDCMTQFAGIVWYKTVFARRRLECYVSVEIGTSCVLLGVSADSNNVVG